MAMSVAVQSPALQQSDHDQLDKSQTPPSTTNAQQHTRTYQACIPCRRRKVRCDLGPVDHPHDPPCVRCRREAKECFFSATRRKKRAADSGADNVEPDDYEVRGGRKRLREGSSAAGSTEYSLFDTNNAAVAASQATALPPAYIDQPLTPGGSRGQRQPLRRPDHQPSFGDSENEEQVNNHTAAILQTAELHHGHDALNVLLAAAQHDTKPSGQYDPYAPSTISPATAQHPSPDMQRTNPQSKQSNSTIDPNILPGDDPETASAHRAWSRFRFVRNGWFTAQEGMNYIEYFYTYLSPLTPICLPDYRHPSRHVALLETEPLLAVTILMIASRYTPLANDSMGRSYALHQRLWDYTRSMIDRVLWGRELPGVYTSSLQGEAGCDVNPLSRRGLLTLGSVESLMLLTEWHSRHVHFPADEDDAELMAPDESTGDSDTGGRPKSVATWIEPCFRSDRMCWKLLNMALSVASEIGVFDKDSSRHAKVMTRDEADLYEQRRLHVKSMLLVYITQTSGRLGVTAMLPEGYAVPSLSELFNPANELLRDIRDIVVHFWLQLARLVKMGNEKLYANRQYTREIIRSGKYKALLHQINPLLTKWRQDVDAYRSKIPPQMYHIMMIEYEHSRVCVNQLALQAVVERCIESNEGESGKAIPPDRLNQWYGDDRENVGAVIDACRSVLKIVVDGLAPGGFLKHAPVRTSFRMISVAMVLVKTFAFGANPKEMSISLNLMQRTVTALREHVVDDSHIANGFARHMSLLVERVPKALKRFPGSGQGNSRGASASGSRGVSQSPAPQSMYPTSSSQMTAAESNGRQNQHHQWFSNIAATNGGRQDGNNHAPHPLDGYDFSNDNGDAFMLMPPPLNSGMGGGHHSSSISGDYGSYGSGYGNGNGGFDGGFGSDGFNDQGWVALPLDNIFGGQNVQQTGFGPTIDGDDMLDVLLRGSIGV